MNIQEPKSYDPDPMPEKKSDNRGVIIACVVGLIAIFCMLPCVAIMILTLLGPQIGNVFSRVTAGLGTATPFP